MATLSEALEIAVNLHMAGRLDEAGAIYGQIVDAAPDHAQSLYLFGTLLCQQDRLEQACPLLERAATQNPTLAGAHLNLARIHVRRDEWAPAADRLGVCLELDPASAEVWDLQSIVERQRGRLDHAIAALERAERLSPGNREVGERLGLLLHDRGCRHLEAQRNAAAVGDLSRAVRLLPFHLDAGFALGTALGETGRIDEACAAYRCVLAWSPAEPRVLHNLGVMLLRSGRADASAVTLRRAVAAAPDHGDPQEALAALFDRRDPDQAIVWSTRALGLKLAAARQSAPLPPLADTAGRTRDVVAYSLWGALEVYCAGAVANARLMPTLLPGWVCRFYHDDTVPAHILAELASLGAELVAMPPAGVTRQGMFWRFLPADDPTVRRFLCRDCDSRPTAREIAAVQEWTSSGLPFHVMRDHVMHMEPVMGGMWGGTAGLLPPIAPEIERFTTDRSSRWNDQHFLAEWLWPRIAGSALIHDGVHPEFGHRFPASSGPAAEGHVGAKRLDILRLPPMMPPDHPADIAEAEGRDGILAHPAGDPLVGRSLAVLGEWLGIETAFCAGLLTAHGQEAVALDMDAGIGAHALALARAAGPRGRVLAFEDRPSLHRCLRRTVAINGLETLVAGPEGGSTADAMPAVLDGARPGVIRANLSRFGDPAGDRLAAMAAGCAATLYLRMEEDTGAASAFERLRLSGYRLWWHLAPVFDPHNRLGTVSNPFPGLVSINLLGLPPGVPPPDAGSLMPVGNAPDGWREAAWHLRCDGR